jgi:RNA polymerase sigma-70 factor (ECF subfamily)
MLSYRYDPSRTFRGWLRRLCESRAVDLLRARRGGRFGGLDAGRLIEASARNDDDDDDHEGAEAGRPLLLRAGERAQEAVKSRVGERTWRAFWRVAVDGLSVRETAEALGMSYAAVFAAHKRVSRMLREEGRCILAEWIGERHESDAPGQDPTGP